MLRPGCGAEFIEAACRLAGAHIGVSAAVLILMPWARSVHADIKWGTK
jgi:hypothetical protein